MQVAGQKILRTNVVLSAANIPTSKGVVFRTFKISEINVLNGVLMAARCRYFLGILSHTGDVITLIVCMIGNRNRHTSEVTVNMDTVRLLLNGIPYDFNTIWSERKTVGVEQRISCSLIGIGRRCIRTISPVFRSEETEIFRYFQIVSVIKAILVVKSVNSVSVGKYPHSLRSYITTVTSIRTQTIYATVTALGTGSLVIAARQIVFLTLVTVVLRRTALRQKDEVHGFLSLIPCAIALDLLHANCICRRIAYCIIILRIIFIGTAIIASLLDVRTAGWCLCRILILKLSCLFSILRLSLSLGPSIGSLNGVFCGSTVNNRHLVFRCRKGGDVIDGQRPGWAHGQRHDSRKCSCEQTFTHILF